MKYEQMKGSHEMNVMHLPTVFYIYFYIWLCFRLLFNIYGAKYSRMDQVKFVEDNP